MGEGIHCLLPFRIQQFGFCSNLLIAFSPFLALEAFLLLTLTALNVSGGRGYKINDSVHFCVLKWLKQLAGLVESAGVIGPFLDLNPFNKCFCSYLAPFPPATC